MLSDREIEQAFPYGFLRVTDGDEDAPAVAMGFSPGGDKNSWHAVTSFDADSYFSRDMEDVGDGAWRVKQGHITYTLNPLTESNHFQTWDELEQST